MMNLLYCNFLRVILTAAICTSFLYGTALVRSLKFQRIYTNSNTQFKLNEKGIVLRYSVSMTTKANIDDIAVRGLKAEITNDDLQGLCDLATSTNIRKIYPGSWSCSSFQSINRAEVCKWNGITCDSNGLIVSLSIANAGVSGTIPVSIGSLTALQRLALSYNSLSGEIPSTIGQLPALTGLFLRYNSLSSSFPESIGKLSVLVDLWLSNNMLSGAIPGSVSGLTALTKLSLSANSLTSSIPMTIGKLSALLKRLALSNNKLTGAIPESICDLSRLMSGDLNDNLFTSIPANIGKLTAMTALWLSNNMLSGEIPSSIGGLKSLKNLDLHANSLRSSIPSTLGMLSVLTRVFLGSNMLSGGIPESIGNITSLLRMRLNYNRLSSTIPSTIGFCSFLEHFAATGNMLTGAIPSSIFNLITLTVLGLNSNSLISSIPSGIGKITALVMLNAAFNMLTGTIPSSIGDLVSLLSLDLTNNLFTSSIPTYISQLTALEYLLLTENSLSGVIPLFIASITSLLELGLGSNHLKGSIPTTIGFLTNLAILNLSDNQLTGTIPTLFGILDSLTALLLNGNHLSSSVPSEFSSSSNLKFLTLQNNSLSGLFPVVVCDVISGYISLSGNQFLCVPWCQDDVDWSSTIASLPRCEDEQDRVLYDMETSLGVSLALQTQAKLQSSSRIIESQHPFPYIFTDKIFPVVQDPSAVGYWIEMSVFHMWGSLYFCLDASCSPESVVGKYGAHKDSLGKYISGWMIPSDVTSLEIRNSSFHMFFQFDFTTCPISDKSIYSCNIQYGFKLTLTTRFGYTLGWDFLGSPPYSVTNPSSQLSQLPSSSKYASRLCQPASSWSGVTCDKGRVTGLSLPGLGLQGTLPTSIGLLTYLTSLDLSGNLVSGSIVSSLGNLNRLNLLKLNLNNIKGTLPEALANSSHLYVLSIANNRLSGYIPTILNSLTSIQFIQLDGNEFVGEISSQLCEVLSGSTATATVSLTHNELLTCYQDKCLDDLDSRLKIDATMGLCVPTSAPTVTPTRTIPAGSTVQSQKDGAVTLNELISIVVVVPVIVLLLIAMVVYRECFSPKALYKKAKMKRLEALPIHRTLTNLGNETEAELLAIIEANILTVHEKDSDGRTALDIILLEKKRVSHDVVHRLLKECLPFDSTGEAVTDVDRVYGWAEAVQSVEETVICAVEQILVDNKKHLFLLANACDRTGRKCIDIASQRCKEAMQRVKYLHGRYEINEGSPEHKSATSLVLFALDHGNSTSNERQALTRNVALKFMRHRHQFENEIRGRRMSALDANFVIPVLDVYDEAASSFREDAISKGYSEYPFCIVMEAANCNLKRAIDQQYIAGHAWHIIRSMVEQLATCLKYLHKAKIVHGDLKPLNVLQNQVRLKLTDFDASVSVGDYIGKKYSSCCIPPEMVTVDSDGKYVVRAMRVDTESPSYKLLPAATTFDMWGLGCIMYLLCTGFTLFPGNFEDNIFDDKVLEELYEWSDSSKERKLSVVTNRTAHNLLSLLLNKDPDKRPKASRVLTHPFLTGIAPARLPGEKAVWDVFISYRVDSDEYHAEVLYEECKKKGLKVWLDCKCLQAGQNWLIECSRALLGSSIVVCILSRGAINHRTKDSQNFEQLRTSSACDNLLFEWRLALEAKKRGLVDVIFPVMVGDMDTNAVYNNYIRSGCGPTAVADVVVESVETRLRQCLEAEGLGLPFEENLTAKAVHEAVISNQAKFVEGDLQASAAVAVKDIGLIKTRIINRDRQRIHTLVDDANRDNRQATTLGQFSASRVQVLVDEVNRLKMEIERLQRQR